VLFAQGRTVERLSSHRTSQRWLQILPSLAKDEKSGRAGDYAGGSGLDSESESADGGDANAGVARDGRGGVRFP
jgi:hypothetical protein